MQLRKFQQEFIRRAFAPGIDVAALSLSRGNGKSFLAAHIVTRALTPGDDLFVDHVLHLVSPILDPHEHTGRPVRVVGVLLDRCSQIPRGAELLSAAGVVVGGGSFRHSLQALVLSFEDIAFLRRGGGGRSGLADLADLAGLVGMSLHRGVRPLRCRVGRTPLGRWRSPEQRFAGGAEFVQVLAGAVLGGEVLLDDA